MRLTPVLLLLSTFVVQTPVAQTPAPTGATPVWTARFSGDIRWQQVTPAGALLVSTDGALAAVDIERGQIVWQKPELGGLPADSVRMVEGSLLMEAARPGLLLVFDPVTGTVLFDSRRLNLTKVVTRRVMPQTGTLLVHGQRQSGRNLRQGCPSGGQHLLEERLAEGAERRRRRRHEQLAQHPGSDQPLQQS